MGMNNIIVDPKYKQWVVDIERRFRQQQIKAVVQVNSCKIEFYWSLGRDICEMDVERRYGKGVIKALSQDLRRNIPEVKGLTPGGLYYCKRFYLLYNKVFEIFPQLEETSVPQLGEILKPMHSALSVAQKYPLNIFAIPWGHHKVLIDNFESEPQKAQIIHAIFILFVSDSTYSVVLIISLCKKQDVCVNCSTLKNLHSCEVD